ncbi:MAG: hypothetical protein RI883_757 [Bacteroidota bacterium]|jgi:hypothetical protein
MKTTFLKLSALSAILSVIVLYSCQQDPITPNYGNVAMNQMPPLSAVQAGNYISYSALESCLGDPLTVVFNNGYNNSCGNIILQMSTDGGATWAQVSSGVPTNGTLSYTFTPTAVGNYLFRGRWNATGGQACSSTGANINFQAGTAAFPAIVTNNCCQLNFAGLAISCDDTREAEYTFTAEEDMDYIKIQGGLTNFTGADAVVTVTGGNLSVSQWTPGGSSNRVIKVEGSVLACEEVTIHITWNSTNGNEIITGNWSVKDDQGVDVAPSIPGLECQ